VATRTVAGTLSGAALLGFAGTTLLTCTQAILSDRHGERRDRALTEANVGAAACAVLAPLLLGLLQDTPAGWRAAMGLPVIVLAWLYLRYRRQPLPEAPARRSRKDRVRLSRSCWLLAGLVAVGIAVEFCLVYFGAELLTSTGLRTTAAATAMSGFYLGILVGRVGGAWLIRQAGRTVPLLWISLAVTMAGFLLFWLSGRPVPAIAGLFVCGLGIANLYPLSLALALTAAPGNGDSANGATQLLGGILVTASPYLLGSLADHLGLHVAFVIEPLLIVACAVLLLAGLCGIRPASASPEGPDGSAAVLLPTRRNEPIPGGQPRGMSNSVRIRSRSAGRSLDERGKPSAWIVVAGLIPAFLAGGIALIVQNWWLFWLSAAVVVLSLPASWIIHGSATGPRRRAETP
jgi:MFS family permease